MKHWGINKIKLGLQQKNISASCIKIALEEIDSKEVLTTVKSLIEKKSKLIKDKNEQLRKKKIAEYVIRKGYSPAMVWDVLQSED
jgi:regulatory protein